MNEKSVRDSALIATRFFNEQHLHAMLPFARATSHTGVAHTHK